jgi:NADH-quinone oxidoreductase subunit N
VKASRIWPVCTGARRCWRGVWPSTFFRSPAYPLAGFFGKFVVFSAALQLNGLAGPAGWLALLAIALSAVALYYYLLVLKQVLVAAPAPEAQRIRVPPLAAGALVAAAGMIVWFGLDPDQLLGFF